jgi:hypothetical protein
MKEDDKQVKVRKPYQKPEIKRFSLRPEEAVLGNCKTTGISGPSGIGCVNVGPCKILGS